MTMTADGRFRRSHNRSQEDEPMITHVVMMKFRPEVSATDIDELEALLDSLPERIAEIQSYDFGRDVIRSDRSYDFALVAVFANLDTLSHYQTHPDHRKVVKRLGAMCDSIIAVDYENAPYRQASDAESDPWESKTLFQRP
jgi:antibiotic biosynthesis monooxygenase (ABM) superfamily enzyme